MGFPLESTRKYQGLKMLPRVLYSNPTAFVDAVTLTDAHPTDGNVGCCHAKALVAAGHTRFCVLTSRVIRMEWATAATSFRDDTTIMVQNRLMH